MADPENWSKNDLRKWLRQVSYWFTYPHDQRDIHYERSELRHGLLKRVQEVMEADKRKQEHETKSIQRNDTTNSTEEIELDDLSKTTAATST